MSLIIEKVTKAIYLNLRISCTNEAIVSLRYKSKEEIYENLIRAIE